MDPLTDPIRVPVPGMNLDTPAESESYCEFCGTAPCAHPSNPLVDAYLTMLKSEVAHQDRYIASLERFRSTLVYAVFILAALAITFGVLWVSAS